ncbi:exodeoxyribonuclease VII large subunit [Vibrio owensii]|uniref:exodeoxyribonuclease VII large subunit n=1 Tax=Vibrio owensii TaxID=696485 RepID=UPI003CC5AF71
MILEQDLHLDVPYSMRSAAKSKGAKPLYLDGKFKCWFVPAGVDVDPFMDWWPSTMRVQLGGEEEVPKEIGISLHDYLIRVKQAVSAEFKTSDWVIAEITNITGSNHKYFELTEYDNSGKERAKVRAALWASKTSILQRFYEVSGMHLAKSMKVLVKVRAEFDPKYGLSLHIDDIDPSFSIGEMEAKLNRIRSKLRENGQYDLNKRFRLPNDFFRVAVLAPEGAAGLGDFLSQSQILQKHNLCSFDFFHATFQGENVVNSMSSALLSISNYQNSQEFTYDCLCIIRGGGDKAGLYALNEQSIAELVATMPIPVITGIGHERDTTVLDEVSCLSLPTPSMVVGYFLNAIVNSAHKSEDLKNRLMTASESVVSLAENQLDSLMQRTFSSSQLVIEKAQSNVDLNYQRMFSLADLKVNEAEAISKDLYRRLLANNPMAILERGYSIVKQGDRVIGTSEDLGVGDAVIKLSDGERAVKVL